MKHIKKVSMQEYIPKYSWNEEEYTRKMTEAINDFSRILLSPETKEFVYRKARQLQTY